VDKVLANLRKVNPSAIVIKANSALFLKNGEQIRGKKVLVIEDGPTVTHGGMGYGAGFVAAQRFGAGSIVDPRPAALGSIKSTFEKYNHLEKVLPAMGYGDKQIRELAATIANIDCDLIVSGTPIDLNRLFKPKQPMLHVDYELEEIGTPTLEDVLAKF
jgi:predicted GTPase